MNILIGTRNAYKVGEMVSYLQDIPDLRIHLLKDQNFQVNVKEDGENLKENASKKAIEISKKTKYLTLASDGGVDIPALGEKWDFLKNQRTVGQEKSDIEKAKTLLEMMKDLEGEERKVKYHHALALARNGELLWVDEGVTERGYIVKELPDENIPEDKWMSHLWYYPEFGKVFNKLDDVELNEVRKQAKELKAKLQKVLLDNNFAK